MSVLLQLLIFAPIIVYLYYQLMRRVKYLYYAILIVASLGLTVLPYFAFQIKPEVHFLEFATLHETFVSYAWYRLGTNSYVVCFILGIIGGSMLTKMNVLFRMEIEQTLLVLSAVVVQVIIAVNNSFWRLDQAPSLVKSLLWYSLGRLVISIALTYIFYMIASSRASMWSLPFPFLLIIVMPNNILFAFQVPSNASSSGIPSKSCRVCRTRTSWCTCWSSSIEFSR